MLVFHRESDRWGIVNGGVGDSLPEVELGQSILWTLSRGGPEFAVLQLNPSYFDYVQGARIGAEGVVILSRIGNTPSPFTKLKVKSGLSIPRNFKYTYTALCMNSTGSVRDIYSALTEGDFDGFLSNENLTLALSAALSAVAAPPSMIIM